jgi:hypothetical protein
MAQHINPDEAKLARAYLDRIASALIQDLVHANGLENDIVELDIQRCRVLANLGLRWAEERPQIQRACEMVPAKATSVARHASGVSACRTRVGSIRGSASRSG